MSERPHPEDGPPKKTHLQHLRDQYAAANGLAVQYEEKAERLQTEICAEEWRIKGFHVGDMVMEQGKRAIIKRFGVLWPEGCFILSNGKPSSTVRTLYRPERIKTAQPSVSGLPANRPDPTVTSPFPTPPSPERSPTP